MGFLLLKLSPRPFSTKELSSLWLKHRPHCLVLMRTVVVMTPMLPSLSLFKLEDHIHFHSKLINPFQFTSALCDKCASTVKL
uniref:Uncharacterized protein n=1 Tax=Anguilla anguilla TaxID=7936 RepID=A0A0E9WYP2_ANGAN